MSKPEPENDLHQIDDLFIIGGGVNGCGIARDAAGRGLRLTLAEMGDLAQATSSASSKLFHGGLRYLEYFELRLVRHALAEREVLLRAMPHISWPMRFVMPIDRAMRFESSTPVSRLLTRMFPWLRGRRPAWLIRLGLFLYDHLGGRQLLPPTRRLDLKTAHVGRPLADRFILGYEYSDCWVDDARLVVLNAIDARARGAQILTRTKVIGLHRHDDLWEIVTQAEGSPDIDRHWARALVNAAGPWVDSMIAQATGLSAVKNTRLVRGSHIVVPALFDHDQPYIFQGTDGRIVFAIPYEQDFTLIGTTDMDHSSAPDQATCTNAEATYLCEFVSKYLRKSISPADIVWSYSGVRALYDDGASNASATTRDYVLSMDTNGAPLLNIFGGKITTYRVLAQAALEKLGYDNHWTAGVPLAGGHMPWNGAETLCAALKQQYPFLTPSWAWRLVRTYGTCAYDLLAHAQNLTDLGQHFGATLYSAEVQWLIENEFAQTADDVVWRRTKLGLRLSTAQISTLNSWMQQARATARAPAHEI